MATLSVKTKRTKPSKHRALGDAEEETTIRDHASMRPLNERALAMGGNSKPAYRRHNKTEVDTWAFKGVADFTRDPSTPGTISANGVAVELSNSAGAVLHAVAFAPTECKLMRSNRRVICKHKGGSGRLTLTQRKQKGSSSFLPIWQLSGHFSKQDIVGDITATPLVVALYIDIAYVDRRVGIDWCVCTRHLCFTQGADMFVLPFHPAHSVPNCKVAKSGLTVQCKDTAVKLK